MSVRSRGMRQAPTQPEMMTMPAEPPYSLGNVIRFFNNNAGLLFLALALYIVGFLSGSVWTENNFLKRTGGSLGAGLQQAGQQQAAAPETPQIVSDEDWKTLQDGAAGVIGRADAKVTMVEFTDYQCPFCSRFFNDSYGTLKKDYIDTGKVKVIIHDQPLSFHPNARVAALAARCAGDQGLLPGNKSKNYESMHDVLFQKQDEWAPLGKEAAITKFGEYAKAAGMSDTQLTECVQTEKFGKAVDADSALGSKVGASGTPTFFIEKEAIVGAQPIAVFQAKLDALLK